MDGFTRAQVDPDTEFIEGFKAAIDALGHEGDWKQADWSAPYKFLNEKLDQLRAERKSPDQATAAIVGEWPSEEKIIRTLVIVAVKDTWPAANLTDDEAIGRAEPYYWQRATIQARAVLALLPGQAVEIGTMCQQGGCLRLADAAQTSGSGSERER